MTMHRLYTADTPDELLDPRAVPEELTPTVVGYVSRTAGRVEFTPVIWPDWWGCAAGLPAEHVLYQVMANDLASRARAELFRQRFEGLPGLQGWSFIGHERAVSQGAGRRRGRGPARPRPGGVVCTSVYIDTSGAIARRTHIDGEDRIRGYTMARPAGGWAGPDLIAASLELFWMFSLAAPASTGTLS
jgi:hypothetical protein